MEDHEKLLFSLLDAFSEQRFHHRELFVEPRKVLVDIPFEYLAHYSLQRYVSGLRMIPSTVIRPSPVHALLRPGERSELLLGAFLEFTQFTQFTRLYQLGPE